jgi:hypothetical protein
MKGMASTPDYYIPPAEGPHPATIIAAEPGLSSKGNTQIKVQVQIDGLSEVIDDYLGTDGTVKGAGISKAKFRGLGVDVTSDAEVPDEVIAANLIGRKCIVELAHENAQKKDGDKYVDATHFIPETGQTIQLKRARIIGFRMANVGGMPTQPQQLNPGQPAPQQPQYAQQQPQQFAQPAAQPPFAQPVPQPQQWAPPAQPQFAQPLPPQPQYAQPQFQQPVPQQYVGGPTGSMQPVPQQQWAPPPGGQQQVQYQQPPQIPQQMQPVQMQPPAPPQAVPWAQDPNAQQANGAEPAKRGPGRPKKVADAAGG